jgi:hypothetical protein
MNPSPSISSIPSDRFSQRLQGLAQQDLPPDLWLHISQQLDADARSQHPPAWAGLAAALCLLATGFWADATFSVPQTSLITNPQRTASAAATDTPLLWTEVQLRVAPDQRDAQQSHAALLESQPQAYLEL